MSYNKIESFGITDAFLFPHGMNTRKNGGAHLRVFNLLKHLPLYYRIFVINHSIGLPEEKNFGNIIQYAIPKNKLHLKLWRLLNFLNGKTDCSHIAVALSCISDALYRRTLKNCADKSSVLISEFPYQFSSIQEYKNKLLIYDAHNIEYLLQKYAFPNTFVGNIIKLYIRYLENKACRNAHIILTCSEEDKESLCLLYKVPKGKVYVIPNGTDTKEIQMCLAQERSEIKRGFGLEGKKIIFFIGGHYLPNVEAIKYIADKLAPSVQDHIFLIAGTAVKEFSERSSSVEYSRFFYRNKSRDSREKFYGYGWYSLEYWTKNLCVRWTGKKWGLRVNKDISGVYFKAMSPGSISGKIFIDGNKIGDFKTSKKWNFFEFHFQIKRESIVGIELQRSWETRGDLRKLGIAITEIGYIFNKEKQKIDLDKLENMAFSISGKENVIFMDDLDDDTKRDVFKMSDIAINPMFHGSGTHIKMFEYMAAGLPVVTTQIGARGIDAQNAKHLIICDISEFDRNIRDLLEDKNLYESIRNNARRLIEEKYDWKVISSGLASIIEEGISGLKNRAT